jgi:hypothetical protein
MNMAKELAALERMGPTELRERYLEVFGEPTNANCKAWLVKRIAWRMQANAEGGLAERALARAHELANDADLRTTAPKAKSDRRFSSDAMKHAWSKTPLISCHWCPISISEEAP